MKLYAVRRRPTFLSFPPRNIYVLSLCGQFSVTCFCSRRLYCFRSRATYSGAAREMKKVLFSFRGDFVHGGRCDVTAVFSLEPLTNDYFSFICPNTDPTHLSEPKRAALSAGSAHASHLRRFDSLLLRLSYYYSCHRTFLRCAFLARKREARLQALWRALKFCRRCETRSLFHVKGRWQNLRRYVDVWPSMFLKTCIKINYF